MSLHAISASQSAWHQQVHTSYGARKCCREPKVDVVLRSLFPSNDAILSTVFLA